MSPSTSQESQELPYKSGFNADYCGRQAECDGGGREPNSKFAGRQDFAGTLTGDYRDFGDYPWRWYLMNQLTLKPRGFIHEAVWCDENSLEFFDDK
jgi:hypothetical protein